MSAFLIVIPWSLYWAATAGLMHMASMTRRANALRPPLRAMARL